MRRPFIALALVAGVASACVDDPQDIGPEAIVRFLISHDSLNLKIGDTIALTGLALDASGAVVVGRDLSWGVDRPDILQVDAVAGTAIGLMAGVATVSARVGDLSAEARVFVAPGPVLVLSGDTAVFTVKAGGANPAEDTLQITNGGGFTVSGLTVDSIAYADTSVADWLMAGIDSGTAPTQLRLAAMTTGLTVPGAYGAAVTVSATDADSSPQVVRVTLRITAGDPATLAANAGEAQTGVVGQTVAIAPSVLIEDVFGNPVPGVAVSFVVISGGGSTPVPPVEGGFMNGSRAILADTVQTDSAGIATVTSWTLGPTVGSNVIEAAITGDTVIAPVTFAATGTPAGATQITATQGGGQSATVGTAVTLQPQVHVQDQFGNDVPGAAVTFSTNAGNGVLVGATAATDAAGLAALGSWTLDTLIGSDTVLAQVAGVVDTVRFIATATADGATTLILVQGDGQVDSVAATLAVNPTVGATDQYGNPVAGVTVGFAVTGGGGGVSVPTVMTGAAGQAATTWTLGSSPGANTMTATAAGLAGSPRAFAATATAGAPAFITVTQGSGQVAVANATVPVAPAVRVTDSRGNSVAGATVTFTVTGGGGSIIGGTQTTSAGGVATLGSWRLGTVAGANTLQAATGALTAPFTATATSAAADTIFAVTGGGQSATVGAAVATAPQVRVTDAFGNSVTSVSVSFSANNGGGVTGGSASTDAGGLAAVGSWTLGTVAGANTLSASASGLKGSPVAFVATGNPGAADTITIAAGNNQTAAANAAVAVAPAVRVVDPFGNTVPGVEVVFAVTTGGGSVTGGTDTTDAAGVAAVGSWTVGTTPGANQVSATATGVGVSNNPITFTATATAGAPASVVVDLGDGQNATAGTAVTTAPSVLVRDQFNNPVPGASVTFAVTSGGGAVNPVGAVLTGAGGIAGATSWTLGSVAGANTLSATVTGAGITGNPVTFTATGLAGAAGGLRIATQPSATATAGALIAQQPVVQLTDLLGNDVSTAGVDVIASLASGAGGTVEGTLTVATDGAGQAVFTDLRVDGAVGVYSIQFGGMGLSGATTNNITVSAAGATTIAVDAGSGGSATVGTAVAQPPRALVTDQFGNPVSGVSVTFALTGGGGSLDPLTPILTDVLGTVTANSWTLGTTAGANTVTATSTGLIGSPAAFAVTGTPDVATTIAMNVGNGQTDTVNQVVPVAPSVRVADQYGNGVSGIGVTFAVTGGGGSITGAAPTTDGSGIATVGSWRLGTNATLANSLSATSGTLTNSPLVFLATAVRDAPSVTASLVASNVGSFTAQGGNSAATITVTVTDQFANPVVGSSIVLAVDGSGNSIAQPGLTNASGQATGSFASTQAVLKTVSATVDGSLLLTQAPTVNVLPDVADAAVSSVASSKASIGASGGTDTTTITVTVRDQFSNPLSGQSVDLASTSTGTFVAASGVSGGTGIYRTTFHASTPLGDRRVSAKVNTTQDLADTVTVALTAGPVSAANSIVAEGTGSITASAGTSTSLITVTARDAFNNPVSGAAVSLGSDQASGSFTAAANTSGSGVTTSNFSSINAALHTITAIAGGVGITDPATVTVNPAIADAGQTTIVVDDASVLAADLANSVAANFRSGVTVTVRDAFGNVRQGDIVTFTPSDANDFWKTTTTGIVAGNVDTTDATGVASRVFHSTFAEGKTLFATGINISENIGVTVSPDAANAGETLIAVDNSSIQAANTAASVTAGFRSLVTVTVRDAYGNNRSGDLVTFTPSDANDFWKTTTTGTTLGNSVTTNTSGVAQRVFFSTFAQAKTLIATGTNISESIGVTVSAAAPSSVTVTNAGFSARVGFGLPTRPTYTVRDIHSNLVTNFGVSYTSSLSGAFSGPATTNASGQATLTSWTMGGAAGDDALGRMPNAVTLHAGSAQGTATSYGIYTWTDAGTGIINTARCNGCHYVNWTRSPNTIVGVADQNGAPYNACSGWLLVAASNANLSLIYRKVAGTAGCGSQMPTSGTLLNTTELKIVRSWINNGALFN